MLGAAIVAVPAVVMTSMGVPLGSPFVLGFAAYVLVVVGGGLLLVRMLQRRRGRAARKVKAVVLPLRTKWTALDQALADYGVRTDTARPMAAYTRRATMGETVDAELVYAGALEPGASMRKFRGPLDALPDDQPMLAFTEAMLDLFNAGELLAVIAHLMARADLMCSGAARHANGASEADSRALLLTHDHVSLLGALEKCSKGRTTPPPGFGFVRFADVDLTERPTAKEGQPHWEQSDRIAELRSHLMAAGLDVPGRDRGWLSANPATMVSPPGRRAFGYALILVAVWAAAGLANLAYGQYRLFVDFDGDTYGLGLFLTLGCVLVVGAALSTYVGLRFIRGARRSEGEETVSG